MLSCEHYDVEYIWYPEGSICCEDIVTMDSIKDITKKEWEKIKKFVEEMRK